MRRFVFSSILLLCLSFDCYRASAQAPLGKADISGDFTAQYQVTENKSSKALSFHSPSLNSDRSKYQRAFLKESYLRAGREVTDAQLDQQVAIEYQAEAAASEQDANASPTPFTLTISGHQDCLLYAIRTAKDRTHIHHGVASSVSVFDGSQTFSQFYGENRVYIQSGFRSDRMWDLPIFCTSLVGVPMVKSLSAIGADKYNGLVLYPGLPDKSSYFLATLEAATVQGMPLFRRITLLDHGEPLVLWQLSKHVKFHSVWVPAHIDVTMYTKNDQGKTVPEVIRHYALTSLHDSSIDLARFALESYLKKGVVVYVPSSTGNLIGFDFDPSKSLNTQIRAATLNDISTIKH